jgi:hypothetical protein
LEDGTPYTPAGPGGTGAPRPKGEGPEFQPAAAEPKGGAASRAPAANPTEKEAMIRWIRSTLPVEWPPYPGWEKHCCGGDCRCLQTVKKYLSGYRLKDGE